MATKRPGETKGMTVELPTETYRLLRIAAAEENTNVSELMRGVVKNFLVARWPVLLQEQPAQEEIPQQDGVVSYHQ